MHAAFCNMYYFKMQTKPQFWGRVHLELCGRCVAFIIFIMPEKNKQYKCYFLFAKSRALSYAAMAKELL